MPKHTPSGTFEVSRDHGIYILTCGLRAICLNVPLSHLRSKAQTVVYK